ncbi:MAG: hypothetical protein IRZ14_05320, partial [Chloroflexi bacterium]|nr:hypothetical protein [Chloroflexota bacterium]
MRDWRPRLRAASLALSLLLLDFGQGAHPAGAHGLHDPPGAHAVREPARVPVARPAGQFPPSALHSLYVLMQGVPGSGQPGIVRIDPPSFAPVIITEGQLLTSPVDIAVDPNGNILVLNVASCSGVISVQCNGITGVIRVDPSTGVQTPLTSGPSYFATPVALAVAPNGTIYVVDSNCCQVFQFPDGYLTGGVIAIDPNTGAQWVVSNPNSSGEYLVAPWGIAVDPNGNPVVVQEGQFLLSHTRVIKIDPASGAQTSVVSGGSLDDPVAIAINDANWYFVADRQCCSDGALIYVNPANASETVVSTGGQFQLPADVALPPGNVISPAYLLDSNCCAGYRGGIFAIDFNTGAQQLVAQNLAGGRLEAIAVVPTPTGNPPVAAPGRLPTSGPTAPRASASSLTPTPGATRTAAGVAGAPAAGTLAPNVPAPTQITPTPLTRAP